MNAPSNLAVKFFEALPEARTNEYQWFVSHSRRSYGLLNGYRVHTHTFPPDDFDHSAFTAWLVDNFGDCIKRYRKGRGH
jgi:hypothetical protein